MWLLALHGWLTLTVAVHRLQTAAGCVAAAVMLTTIIKIACLKHVMLNDSLLGTCDAEHRTTSRPSHCVHHSPSLHIHAQCVPPGCCFILPWPLLPPPLLHLLRSSVLLLPAPPH